MRRGLIFRTRHSLHKKSTAISACGNFSTRTHTSVLAFSGLGANGQKQPGTASGGWRAGLFPPLRVLFYIQH